MSEQTLTNRRLLRLCLDHPPQILYNLCESI